jgi:NADH:ubiquinone reductase (H+-translocating)
VRLTDGTELPTATVVWAAGVRASPLSGSLGLAQTRGGRIVVDAKLRVADHDGVYVIGDVAAAPDGDGGYVPQLAPAAMQQGRHVAEQILRRLDGQPLRSFRYRDKGMMATIGRNAAVAELPGGIRFRGWPAWVAWLLLHLLFLIGFRNRASVLLQWMWSYWTYDRAARVVFDDLLPPAEEPAPG